MATLVFYFAVGDNDTNQLSGLKNLEVFLCVNAVIRIPQWVVEGSDTNDYAQNLRASKLHTFCIYRVAVIKIEI